MTRSVRQKSRPFGKASSECASSAKTRFALSTPIVYGNAAFASWSPPSSAEKPTAASSRPKRAYGGRRSATTPAPTNVRQTTTISAACPSGLGA